MELKQLDRPSAGQGDDGNSRASKHHDRRLPFKNFHERSF
jgi:hypothetical protein